MTNRACRGDRRHIGLIALIREEPESARFATVMMRELGTIAISSANYLEAAIVVDANDDAVLSEKLDIVISYFQIEIVPVSVDHARRARQAFRDFGTGRHPARLNFGDCFSYALAAERRQPLMFKGDDFSRRTSAPPFDRAARRHVLTYGPGRKKDAVAVTSP